MRCGCDCPSSHPKQVLEHSGSVNSKDCPCIACSSEREVRAELTFPSGQKRVLKACERHIALYVARAVARVRKQRGDDHTAKLSLEEELDMEC